MRISIIVPCFNEEAGLREFYSELSKSVSVIAEQTEILFIDDGSSDRTLDLIKNGLSPNDHISIRYVSFSRNFGKEAAILAGLEASRGEYVAMIDADLQDDPSLLVDMYRSVTEQGYDCVAVRRLSRRNEPKLRSYCAELFYRIMGKLSQLEIVPGERDYRMMSRQVVEAVLSLQEKTRYSRGIFSWVGFNTLWLEEEYSERSKGRSKWSFGRLFSYALDAIICFSALPLALASMIGLLFCLFSAIGIVFIIVRQLIWGGSAYGWPSLVCIILLIAGVQLFCMGILGQYLAKTFTETKNRPMYIVKESSDDEKS